MPSKFNHFVVGGGINANSPDWQSGLLVLDRYAVFSTG